MQAISKQVDARRPKRMPMPVLAALAALLALAALAAPGVARAAAPLTWSGPASNAPAVTGPVSLSCPSSGLCLAVDGEGSALISADPLSPSPSWQADPVTPGRPLAGISCASASLCLAVGGEADAFLSTNPTSPSPSAWQAVEIDKGKHLTGISCLSSSLCVAIDSEGGALISTSPTSASPAAWQRVEIAEAHHLAGISCIATSVCVAVDGEGDALVSSLLGPTWSATKIDATALTAVSCSASGLCVAVDAAGGSLASDDPAGAPPQWDATAAPGAAGGLSSVSCLPGGRCLAAGPTTGRGALALFSGSVPAPGVATGAATAVGETGATLTGAVDPADAVLSSCQFEYGTSASYGQSVPCAPTPASTASSQPVSASIAGLAPGTTYHFRLSASDGAGAAAGADQSFRTGPPPPVAPPPIVYPRPYISGTPALGRSLTCEPNLLAGAQATLSYAWLRGLVVIPGATSDVYSVKGTDTAHHLQCRVTATNAGGSATRTSGFVAIPAEGVLAAAGETEVARARLDRTHVDVAIRCAKQAPRGCAIGAKLTVRERLRGTQIVAVSAQARRRRRGDAPTAPRRGIALGASGHARAARRAGSLSSVGRASGERTVTVTIGLAKAHLRAGHERVLKIPLNREGTSLLRSHQHGLRARLLVTGTVIGAITATLRRETVPLTVTRRRSRGHRARRSSSHGGRARGASSSRGHMPDRPPAGPRRFAQHRGGGAGTGRQG